MDAKEMAEGLEEWSLELNNETMREESQEQEKETEILDATETLDMNGDGENDLSTQNEEQPEKLLKLPMSRIKKIMKMDPDVNFASQEAVFLITKATELMLDSLAKEAYSYTASENKKTVTKKHVEMAISNTDALAFLEGTLD